MKIKTGIVQKAFEEWQGYDDETQKNMRIQVEIDYQREVAKKHKAWPEKREFQYMLLKTKSGSWMSVPTDYITEGNVDTKFFSIDYYRGKFLLRRYDDLYYLEEMSYEDAVGRYNENTLGEQQLDVFGGDK